MNKVICLYDTYAKYMDIFDGMKERAGDYVPSPTDMTIIKENIPKFVPFLLWIDDTGYETDENREMRHEISRILRECLIITNGGNKT